MNEHEFQSIRPIRPVERTDAKKPVVKPEQPTKSFEKILGEEVSRRNIDIKFSSHALNRMRLNRIELSSEDLQKIDTAFNRADEKGAKDALLILRDMALITSVKNRTVITVVDDARMKENIFTKIDSAVIL